MRPLSLSEAPIQRRTSTAKFPRSPCTDPPGVAVRRLVEFAHQPAADARGGRSVTTGVILSIHFFRHTFSDFAGKKKKRRNNILQQNLCKMSTHVNTISQISMKYSNLGISLCKILEILRNSIWISTNSGNIRLKFNKSSKNLLSFFLSAKNGEILQKNGAKA